MPYSLSLSSFCPFLFFFLFLSCISFSPVLLSSSSFTQSLLFSVFFLTVNFLSFCHSSVLLPLQYVHMSVNNQHPSSFLHSIPLSIQALSLLYLSFLFRPSSFSPECQPVSAVVPITYFSHQSLPVFIDTISQKKSNEGHFEIRKPSWFLFRTERGRLDILNILGTDRSYCLGKVLDLSFSRHKASRLLEKVVLISVYRY